MASTNSCSSRRRCPSPARSAHRLIRSRSSNRREVHMRIALVLAATLPFVFGVPPAAAQTPATMPADIDPQSGFRLPLPKREELDELGKKVYDEASTPGKSLVGLQGPSGIRLYSPKTSQWLTSLNRHLRFEAGMAPRIREMAILITAREMESQCEWAAREPEGRKAGRPRQTSD